MNPQPRTKAEQDSRHERLSHARQTGDYLTFPGGGGVPMVIEDGVIRIAMRFRTKVQIARKEIIEDEQCGQGICLRCAHIREGSTERFCTEILWVNDVYRNMVGSKTRRGRREVGD